MRKLSKGGMKLKRYMLLTIIMILGVLFGPRQAFCTGIPFTEQLKEIVDTEIGTNAKSFGYQVTDIQTKGYYEQYPLSREKLKNLDSKNISEIVDDVYIGYMIPFYHNDSVVGVLELINQGEGIQVYRSVLSEGLLPIPGMTEAFEWIHQRELTSKKKIIPSVISIGEPYGNYLFFNVDGQEYFIPTMVDAEDEKDWLSFEKGTVYPSEILLTKLRDKILNVAPPSPFQFIVQGTLIVIFITIIACISYQWFHQRKSVP